jgi:hypothetical protein
VEANSTGGQGSCRAVVPRMMMMMMTKHTSTLLEQNGKTCGTQSNHSSLKGFKSGMECCGA